MALLMNAAELLSRLPTIPSSNSDLDEHEDHKAILQDAPSMKANPEDELILRNVPSVQAEPNNEDNELFVADVPSSHDDSDELEDHERILHNDLLASIAMQEEGYPVADTSPPPSPCPNLFGTPTVAAPAVSSSFTSHDEFTRSQIADQPRLSWNWRNQGKDRTIYTPTVVGKWWYRTSFELERLPKDKCRSFGHIGRIMETELGKQRFGDARCGSVGSIQRRAQHKFAAQAKLAPGADSSLKLVGAACRRDSRVQEATRLRRNQEGQFGQPTLSGGCFRCLIRPVHRGWTRRGIGCNRL
ncbi:hypothetical protein BDV37DRAFT_288833 [Aspergillus pseudonomiae]|uniref:Uncharacterized protein n=1 Tax=Aspergillus pseudonomiae TaxID=1506151 RepID=A0A5N7CVB0_9EURO|nr:uncharacterized protein BDV37DRAFT_288833 [Aspergillus pseudonomiae]KAE8398122.1 hypothetical protein BDV37DRAFT_288833 [Aspergillus pseudonomiae]